MFFPYGYYHRDDDAPWHEPVKLGKILGSFIMILVFLYAIGAVVFRIKDPIPRWGMDTMDK